MKMKCIKRNFLIAIMAVFVLAGMVPTVPAKTKVINPLEDDLYYWMFDSDTTYDKYSNKISYKDDDIGGELCCSYKYVNHYKKGKLVKVEGYDVKKKKKLRFTTTYYYKGGKLVKEVTEYPDSDQKSVSTYTYNKGKLTKQKTDDGTVVSYKYKKGVKYQVTLKNGKWKNTLTYYTSGKEKGYVRSITNSVRNGGLETYSYQFDKDGRIIRADCKYEDGEKSVTNFKWKGNTVRCRSKN